MFNLKYHLLTKIKNRTLGKFPQLSYSRSGEDLILEELLGIHNYNGFYIDIGAYHPVKYSNTYKFYLKGWRGINVDASLEVINEFNQYRKRDININMGIGEGSEDLTYYIFKEDPSMNTMSVDFVEHAVKTASLTIKEERKIKVSTIESILNKNLVEGQKIDFMSIDVEGFDLLALKTNNWSKYRPKVVVVETKDSLEELNDSQINLFMKSTEYKPVAYSLVTRNAGNIYYVDINQ